MLPYFSGNTRNRKHLMEILGNNFKRSKNYFFSLYTIISNNVLLIAAENCVSLEHKGIQGEI